MRLTLDSTVVFNEVMFHPSSGEGQLEWLELHNTMAVNIDMSNWRLTGGVEFVFPAGTVLAGGGYLVVAADPTTLQTAGIYAGAAGPWSGLLDNAGETLQLVDNDGRELDRLEYGDDNPWPVAADGSGASLSKFNPNAATALAESWRGSLLVGGTPGARNFTSNDPTLTTLLPVGADAQILVPSAADHALIGSNWKNSSFVPGAAGETPWLSGPTGVGFDTAAVSYPTEVLADAPRGYWRFEETGGAVANDSSGLGRNAAYNSVTLGATGAAATGGRSATFNGSSSYVQLPGTWGGAGWNALTIEAWVNTADPITGDFQSVLSGHDPSTFVHFQLNSVGNMGAYTNGGFITLPIVPVTPTGQWRHVVMVVQSGNSRVYVDGQQFGAPVTTTFSSIDPGSNVSIGLGHAGGRWFRGKLDEVAVYNTALSADRVLAHYTAGQGEANYTSSIETDLAAAMLGQQATAYLRMPFTVASLAAVDALQLQIKYDDGFVVYLNGALIASRNAPASPTYNSTATGPRADSSAVQFETIDLADSIDLLVGGTNILAIQALNVNVADDDFLLVPKLLIHQGDTTTPLAINEVAGASEAQFSIELANHGNAPLALGGYVIRSGDAGGSQYVIGAQTLAAGQFVTFTQAQLGFHPAAGTPIFLYAPGELAVVDAVVAKATSRARSPDGVGPWLRPDVATPNAANSFDLHDEIVINEIMYHHQPTLATPGTPDTVQTITHVPLSQTWKYLATGGDQGTVWRGEAFDDSTWLSGQGLLGFTTNPTMLPDTLRKSITPALRTTYYFRTTFEFSGDPTTAILHLRAVIDDGAVIYLNGQEVTINGGQRLGMAAGAFTFTTPANRNVAQPPLEGPFTLEIPAGVLHAGANTLAVEVHQFSTSSTDMILGLEITSPGVEVPGTPPSPYIESPEEWIELFNRGNAPVDLASWQLSGGVDYQFPPNTILAPQQYLVVAKDAAALLAKYPGLAVIGNFSGSLANSDEQIVLQDSVGNPADAVHYYDGGRWPSAADGGGSSLELRSPSADNSVAESWAASDESSESDWATYTYRGKATADIGPTNYNELILGLLDSGEVLLDDIRVTADPDVAPKQLIQNGSFTSGTANTWRLLGNHSHTEVILDPDNAANQVLRLVSTGQTEHMSNHLETTLKDGATFHTISATTTYEISFRAKWISGSRQLRSNLYFNRLPHVTEIVAPVANGTPGAANSEFAANLGPSYAGMLHSPAVPAAGQDVTVSVEASDPNGVSALALWYRVNGGAWTSTAMNQVGGGPYRATIPGQNASAIVQFYVAGQDVPGATSMFPAAGSDSRALYKVQDNLAVPGGAHELRIVMTAADTTLLHTNSNLMSNDSLGATVIYNENEIFYDVGVRLKGSPYGRPIDQFVSYDVNFHPEQKFRGVYESIGIDRSARGPVGSPNVDEIVIRQIANHAGGIANVYDDIVHVITPLAQHTSVAILKLEAYGGDWLDSYYEGAGDNPSFEFDGAYYFTRTVDGTPEGLKIVEPGPISYTDIRNLGADKETYRRNWRTTNHQEEDDYEKIIALNQAFSLTGPALAAAVASIIDVDQWMRHYALLSLTGVADTYTHGNPHNLRVYERPTDGKLISLPHDMDTSFLRPYNAFPLWGDPSWNLVKIIQLPQYKRLFLGHLDDMIDTTFNSAYMGAWTTHYAELAGSSFASILGYIDSRAGFVENQLASVVASVPFRITTGGGANFNVNTPTVTLAGDAWIDVREIRILGRQAPLAPTWTDDNSWQAVIPLAFGQNDLTFQAFDYQGNLIGSDTISIGTTAGQPPQQSLRVTELMYHPADPTAGELAIDPTFTQDDFEFLEIQNIGASTIDLAGVQIIGDVTFNFTGGSVTSLAPGGYVIVVESLTGFAARYGAGLSVAGEFGGQLSNSGGTLTLQDALGVEIQTFTFDDQGVGWHPSTDGDGYSLVIVDAQLPKSTWNDGSSWRPSTQSGGSPGLAEPAVTVQGRRLFYNNSAFDGHGAAAEGNDDLAIASDKSALLPGQIATFANYTSYSQGINGVMIDLANLPAPLTAADFTFRVGNSDNLESWTPLAAAPQAVVTRVLAGNVSRVTVTWAEGAVKNLWLQVTVNAPGMAAPDVFYFGSAVGETGNTSANALVNSTDELAVRANPHTFLNPATVLDVYDFNRDGFVNATDQIIARTHATTLATALKLIAPPNALAPSATTAHLAETFAQQLEPPAPDAAALNTTLLDKLAQGFAAPRAVAKQRLEVDAIFERGSSKFVGPPAAVVANDELSFAETATIAPIALTADNQQMNSADDGHDECLGDELFELLAADLIAAGKGSSGS